VGAAVGDLSQRIPRRRHLGGGFWNALVSASVTFVFPWELSTLGSAGTFLIYGLFASAALLFVVLFVPETKGRTLEQLEGELMSHDGLRAQDPTRQGRPRSLSDLVRQAPKAKPPLGK
jgi:hypothetical protein